MGNKTTNINKGLNNRSDGHLLGYIRNTFVRGGGGNLGQSIIAFGGTTQTTSLYRYHIFTSPGTFNVDYVRFPLTVEYLIVAGGGCGRSLDPAYGGGGGGSGGLRTGTFPVFSGYSTPVSVGGGAAVDSPNGTPSSAFGIIANGGGAGGKGSSTPGVAGGSGGGSSSGINFGTGNTPPTTPSQGNNGGSASGAGGGGGGGGGAGAVGNDYSSNPSPPAPYYGGGPGGSGVSVFSDDPNFPTSYGTPGPSSGRWFAGGGGGGTWNISYGDANAGQGGVGGGGRGAFGSPISSVSGASNTGGGGGGSSQNNGGSAGGSGIVIIRYSLT